MADDGVEPTVARTGGISYLRVPAALSLLMLVVFFGTVGGRGEGAYRAVSGLEYEGYAMRWLLVSAALFAVSLMMEPYSTAPFLASSSTLPRL